MSDRAALYADATEELIEFAELLQVPVMTTMAGKSVFPENHPLSIGSERLQRHGNGQALLE